MVPLWAPNMAHNVYQRTGIDFKVRAIDPAVQEAGKAVTAEFTAEQLISERPKVREETKRLLSDRLSPFRILGDDFSIINFGFSKEFNRAIEEKQTAEQLALRARRDLIAPGSRPSSRSPKPRRERNRCGCKSKKSPPNSFAYARSRLRSKPSKKGMDACQELSEAARCRSLTSAAARDV